MSLTQRHGDDDTKPFVLHFAPLVHIEVEAEDSLTAQQKAQRRVLEQLRETFAGTEMDIHRVNLEDITIDQQQMMQELLGGGDDMEMLGDPTDLAEGLDVDDEEEP